MPAASRRPCRGAETCCARSSGTRCWPAEVRDPSELLDGSTVLVDGTIAPTWDWAAIPDLYSGKAGCPGMLSEGGGRYRCPISKYQEMLQAVTGLLFFSIYFDG